MDFSYWPFSLLAIMGAIAANATGAGGGVVFIPAFTFLQLEESAVFATSFAIQCFGMTAGMLSWRHYAQHNDVARHWQAWGCYRTWYWRFTLPAIAGVLLGQYAVPLDAFRETELIFKGVSLVFGTIVLAAAAGAFGQRKPLQPHTPACQSQIRIATKLALPAGLVGGFITGLISIGVGEIVAVTLILLRFPVTMAIGIAVSVSAFCVLIGVQYYLWIEPAIEHNILLFAGPAAIVGGTIAKYLANSLPAVHLKIFIGVWILFCAIAM